MYYIIYLWWTALAIGVFLYKVPKGTRKAWFSDVVAGIITASLCIGLLFSVLLIIFVPGPAFLSSNMFLALLVILFEVRR